MIKGKALSGVIFVFSSEKKRFKIRKIVHVYNSTTLF